jgi:Glycosyl hydrolase family 59
MAKPLWESELGATPATGTNPALPGPGGLARALNGAYNQAGITGILVWPLIDAIPPDLPHENRGLALADLPWDGYYDVTPLTWVIAQTTQVTAPGWRHAAGANGDLPAGGSYDTYLAPGRSAWSMVAETSVATAPQQITIHVTGGLPARVVHVWSTNLRGPGQFIQRGDIIPHEGAVAVTVASGSVAAARAYTLNLTTRGTAISARINGVLVAAVTNRMYRYGPAGLWSLGYYPVLYPSFTIR